MDIKRKICFVLLIFAGKMVVNAFDLNTLNGIWLGRSTYNWVVNNPKDRHLNTLTMLEDRFQISWDKDKNRGVLIIGMEPNNIQKIETFDNEIKMTYGYWENVITFRIISEKIIQVINHPYNSKIEFLYRICNIEKPVLGVGNINENGVRFRDKPELTSGFFYLLNKNEHVEIIGRSKEKQKIGEMEDYWYEVSICDGTRNKNSIERGLFFLDGWVFGAYINIENNEEFEKKIIKN